PLLLFSFTATAATELYPLSLHDALPISSLAHSFTVADAGMTATRAVFLFDMIQPFALATQRVAGFALGLSTCLFAWGVSDGKVLDRKSTRLNSSHLGISYAVFCLKKKNI